MEHKPKLAVSACLLGEKVRYNGEASEFRALTQKWNGHFEMMGVCPEVGIGMATPRPTIRLVNNGKSIRLVNPKNGDDLTSPMLEYAQLQADVLVESGICGFVFKKDSASCGLERVKVYREGHTHATHDGMGMFAKIFTTLYPHIPVIEEDQLTDARQAEHYLARVHFFSLWYQEGLNGWTPKAIMEFHNVNKLFLLSRSANAKRRLERLIAQGFDNDDRPETVALAYMTEAQQSLKVLTKSGPIAHAMERVLGKLSSNLSKNERQEVLDTINDFRQGLLPRSAPLTLLQHHLRRCHIDTPIHQRFLSPIPQSLGLMARV
ncbi:MAG: DUF523 and DUF1722 domain-containing protein [Candidatus Poseidoniaceae archaeon]|nr:DUF523 and DUF1722 domain-containing protein [Candidatus Poseidoniaceae archaeon]